MFVRVFELRAGAAGPRSRAKTIALIAAALAVGATLVAFALMLLMALAAAAAVLGAGVLVYRRLTGRHRHGLGRAFPQGELNLDPTLEVFPERPARSALPPDDTVSGR